MAERVNLTSTAQQSRHQVEGVGNRSPYSSPCLSAFTAA